MNYIKKIFCLIIFLPIIVNINSLATSFENKTITIQLFKNGDSSAHVCIDNQEYDIECEGGTFNSSGNLSAIQFLDLCIAIEAAQNKAKFPGKKKLKLLQKKDKDLHSTWNYTKGIATKQQK